MANEDVAHAVLQERVAEFLCIQIRALHGKPRAGLAQVPLGEATQMRQWAAGVLRLAEEIRAERPPTPFEIHCYQQRTALVLAHSRVRCHATANSHALSVWRPDAERQGYELAACERCGAGASIHLGTSQEFVSDELLRVCPRAPFFQSGASR